MTEATTADEASSTSTRRLHALLALAALSLLLFLRSGDGDGLAPQPLAGRSASAVGGRGDGYPPPSSRVTEGNPSERESAVGAGTAASVLRVPDLGPAGYNNQRQVLMLGAWTARELGLRLSVPRRFNANWHSAGTPLVLDVYDVAALAEYVGSEVLVVEKGDEAKRDAAAVAATIRLEVNSFCPGTLTGDLLRSTVRDSVADRGLSDGTYDVELTGVRFFDLDSGFPADERGSDDLARLFSAFRFSAPLSRCADEVFDKVIKARCPGGVHAAHLRVGNRDPSPLLDCSRGEELFGKELAESGGSAVQCRGEGWKPRAEDVLAADLPPSPHGTRGALGAGQCVYVATNGPHSQDMLEFRRRMDEEGGGAQLLTYADVAAGAPESCGLGLDGGAVPDPSFLEQALLSRVPGRYVAYFPSSWDAYVLHWRLQRGYTRKEPMFMAREDLRLYRTRITKSNEANRKRARKRGNADWCIRINEVAPGANSRRTLR